MDSLSEKKSESRRLDCCLQCFLHAKFLSRKVHTEMPPPQWHYPSEPLVGQSLTSASLPDSTATAFVKALTGTNDFKKKTKTKNTDIQTSGPMGRHGCLFPTHLSFSRLDKRPGEVEYFGGSGVTEAMKPYEQTLAWEIRQQKALQDQN